MSETDGYESCRTIKYTMATEPGARVRALVNSLKQDRGWSKVTSTDGKDFLRFYFDVKGPEASRTVQTLNDGCCAVWQSAPRVLQYQYDCTLTRELMGFTDGVPPKAETKECVMTDTVKLWVNDHADNRFLVDEWASSGNMDLEGLLEAACESMNPRVSEATDSAMRPATIPLECLSKDDEDAESLGVWVTESLDRLTSDRGESSPEDVQNSRPSVICVPASFKGDNKRFTVEMEIRPASLAAAFSASNA